MNHRMVVVLLVVVAVPLSLLLGQRQKISEPPPFEYRALLPHEFKPGQFQLVDRHEIERLSRQGWELVSMSPFVLLNEEHKKGTESGTLTQVYNSYHFRRRLEP